MRWKNKWIWTFRCRATRESLCANWSSRASPPKLSGELSSQLRSAIEMFKFIYFSNAQIPFYKLVHEKRKKKWREDTYMYLHHGHSLRHDIIVTFCSYSSFFCKLWCKVKRILLRRARGPRGGGGTRGVRHTGMCRSNRSLFWEKSLNIVIGYGFELENP